MTTSRILYHVVNILIILSLRFKCYFLIYLFYYIPLQYLFLITMFISRITCKYSTTFNALPDIIAYFHFMLYTILPSLPCLSEKTYVALCFSFKIGRSAMACFRLLHSECDVEVMFRLPYGYDTSIHFLY